MTDKRPIRSHVAQRYTLTSVSVDRKHGSHYVQQGQCQVLYYPRLPDVTPIILPEESKKPKEAATFRFWVIQILQAAAEEVNLAEVLTGDLEPLRSLFSQVEGEEGAFRSDLPLGGCNHLLVADKFEVADPMFNHETLKRQCLEEFVRVFGYIEVMAVNYKTIGLELATLKEMTFARITGTDYAVRDNAEFHGGVMPEPPMAHIVAMMCPQFFPPPQQPPPQ